jgi:hypothetical protein
VNFSYSDEVIDALERTLSTDRVGKYAGLADNDKEQGLRLYVYNTRVSEAFYTPLQGLEVCLRNSINHEMVKAFQEDWYEDSVAPLQHPLTEMISKARESLKKDKKDVTPGRMVAELNFGFWVGIIGPRYENDLWRPALRHAFPKRPNTHERKQVQNALNAVRRLRNRVAHHEPILHRNLNSDHALILQVVSWMCEETASWIKAHSRFADVHED